MSQTIGSDARVRWDPPDRLSRRRWEKNITSILELLPELREAWSDAVDGGVWAPRDGEPPTLGRGFSDVRPTESAAHSPMRAELRRAAGQAAEYAAEALALLEDASITLANANLRTDPQEWIRAQEKRQAATQRR